jgi:two-component system sensor histidine kinase CiaH
MTDRIDEGLVPRALQRIRELAGAPARSAVPTRASSDRGSSADAVADQSLVSRVRWRLVAWSAGTTLLVLLLLGGAVYAAVARSLATTGQQQIAVRADMVRQFMQQRPFFGDPRFGRDVRPPIGFSVGGPAPGTFAYIVGPGGLSFGPTDLSTDGLPDDASLAAARAGSRDVREITVGGTPLRVLSEQVQVGGNTFVVQVAQDITSEQRTLRVLLGVLLGGGLLGVAGAMMVGAVYARRALVPIRESLRRQREFAADASHEFRTPLAVIRSSVEHLERHPQQPVAQVGDALHDIRDEVDHLTALVGDLLLLARTDSGAVELERVPLDLADVAAEALAGVATLAERRNVQLMLDPEPAPMTGDPFRLRQLVTILVDNAISHSPPRGTVRLTVRASKAACRLRVDDQGPGIKPDDIPHVFDRFWRAAGAPAGGTGLGLSIAAWVVERHGGTIAASNRAEGGASFEVTLPR